MIDRLALLLGTLALLVAGCANSSRAGRPAAHEPTLPASMPQARGSAPEIYLTGFVLRNNVTQQDTLIDLTATQPNGAPLAPNLPLLFEHEATLRVRHQDGEKLHDYRVLLGPDPESDAFAAGQVKTSAATMNLTVGWIALLGQLPLTQTDLVSTSAEGTAMAVRVQSGPIRHYVYNLEPTGSKSMVKVLAQGQTILLQPRTYVIVSPRAGSVLTPLPIAADDAFIAHVQARAAVAGFPL